MYSGQLGRGDAHTKLQPVVSILVLNFRGLAGERFQSVFRLMEIHGDRPSAEVSKHRRADPFSDALELDFLELPNLPPVGRGSPDASELPVLNWGRFLAAETDQELERLAMTDSDLRAAKAALDRLSADPKAQRLARDRELAAWNYERTIHLSREEGRAEGEAALRKVVLALCDVLGIAVTLEREQKLDALDLSGLENVVARLRAERAWPG